MLIKLNKAFTILIAMTLILSFSTYVEVLADDDTIVLKVGYTENYGIVKSPSVDNYMGYGYEYFEKISEYTNYKYKFEYVLCDWDEAFNMIESGELDLLAPVSYNDERADKFIYSKNYFSRDTIMLIALDDTLVNQTDFAHLNGTTIGVQKGDSTIVFLEKFLEKNDINLNIEEKIIGNYTKELKEQNYDFILASSMQMENNLNVVTDIGSEFVYIIANPNSQDIIDDIDNAIDEIMYNEYLFQEKLALKYFDYDFSKNQFVTSDEYDLLLEKPLYTVGVRNLKTSLGYYGYDQLSGTAYDTMNFIADKTGINVNFVEIDTNTPQEKLDQLDLYFTSSGNIQGVDDNYSNSYHNDTLLLIKNNDYKGTDNVGVLKVNKISDELAENYADTNNVIQYSNIGVMTNDFADGKLSKILIGNSLYQITHTNIKNTDITTTKLDYIITSKILFNPNISQEQIDIFNKVLSYIEPVDVERFVLNNTSIITDIYKIKNFKRYIYTVLIFVLLIVLILIFNKINKEIALRKATNFDDLTGLYSQKKFLAETRKLLNDNVDKNYIMHSFDIDNFRYINELYKFETGDKILTEIGHFIKDYTELKFPSSRLSSDIFILVLENDENKQLQDMPDEYASLRKNINNFIDESYNIDFSVGSYEITDISLDVEKMIDYCNLARSYSKQSLGTSVNLFSNVMQEREAIKNDIAFRMNKAIEDKEFVLYYQPKFEIATQKIVGAEALVRWFADGKMMPPNDFIPLFEKNGFIEKLDYYVLDTACDFISSNKNINIPLISINISSITIMKKDVVQNIIDTLDKYSLSPKQVELEITESAFVDHFDVANSRINHLRSKGFTISMDDFGTGVSSLGRLKNMEIDVLKIDREFIIETLQNDKSDVILQNIIKMANQLNLETIAEGIETIEQLGFLKDNGCDLGQGYYFARPLPADDFLKLLD